MATKIQHLVQTIDSAIHKPSSIADMVSMLYHENSKIDRLGLIKQGASIGAFSSQYMQVRASQPYKVLPGSKLFLLDEYKDIPLPQADLLKAIQNRRSVRKYNNYSISLYEIYILLHHAYGISGNTPINGTEGVWSYRTVPSGGALYPLEIYIYIHQGALTQGIYHYRPDINALEMVTEGDQMEILKQNMVAEPYINIDSVSCIVFVSSIMQRTLLKYGERGYRFVLQEVGFVGQNISLICEAIGLSSCMIGSFFDDEINKLILADGFVETTQAVISIGQKQ